MHFENEIEHKILVTYVIEKVSAVKTQSAITQKGRLKTENGFQTAFLILETETRFRKSWPRRQESNLYFTLRRHTFYPLNYGEDLKLRKTKRNA